MEIVVNDTNILIDLCITGLIEYCHAMPIAMHTIDFVLHEITDTEQRDAIQESIDKGFITVKNLDADDVQSVFEFYSDAHQYSNVSPTDCAVILYAEKHSYRLLTADQKLRRVAELRGLQVNGMLWLTDLLVNEGIISPKDMIPYMECWKQTNQSAPRRMIDDRIYKLRAMD